MRPWLSLLLALATAGAAHATPAVGGDELGDFMAERRLADRLEGARERIVHGSQQMAHQASELVVAAMGHLGVPYRRGGNSFDTGFDCSGFVKALYEQAVGVLLPRRAEEQAAATRRIGRHELQPGDLVFFNTLQRAFSHVGIYVGDHKFIHSPRPGARVRVEDMRVSYWSRRFDGARRVLASAEPAEPALVPAGLPLAEPISLREPVQPVSLLPAPGAPFEAP